MQAPRPVADTHFLHTCTCKFFFFFYPVALQYLSLLQSLPRPLGAVQQREVWQRIARLFEAIPKRCFSNPCSCGSDCPLVLVSKIRTGHLANQTTDLKKEEYGQPYPNAFSCVLYGEGSALAPHAPLIQSWVLSYRLRGHTIKKWKWK